MAHAASAAVVVSSVADYEARIETDGGSNSEFNNTDSSTNVTIGSGNIDTPSDAGDLRIGYQSRHKINAAFFFQLPALGPNEQFTSAGLNFTQIKDSSSNTVPAHNADLWAVGVYNNISTANDPDATGKADTVGADNLAQAIYLSNDQTASDTVPAPLNTTVPQRRLQNDFLKPADFLPNNGATASALRTYSSSSTDPNGLADYLNDLYAADPTVAGKYLVIRLNPDSFPTTLTTQRYQIASANNGTAANRPSLTFETAVVPEPAAAGLTALASLGLMLKRRR